MFRSFWGPFRECVVYVGFACGGVFNNVIFARCGAKNGFQKFAVDFCVEFIFAISGP